MERDPDRSSPVFVAPSSNPLLQLFRDPTEVLPEPGFCSVMIACAYRVDYDAVGRVLLPANESLREPVTTHIGAELGDEFGRQRAIRDRVQEVVEPLSLFEPSFSLTDRIELIGDLLEFVDLVGGNVGDSGS